MKNTINGTKFTIDPSKIGPTLQGKLLEQGAISEYFKNA